MTAFLPEFLPDELLYSTIARWRDRMLPRDQKTVLDELFGRPTGIAVVDFPGHLDAFLARLPPRHPHEAEALLDRHTPLPYYAPFVPSDRLDLVRSRLRRGGSGGIPDLLGIRASTVRSPRSLQFCPACAEYDHARFGEPYWHRCHQLPGVWVCHVHRAPLWTSGIRRSGGAGRHVFRSLSLALASSTRPLDPPSEGGALWEWIARETADLLTGGSRQMSGLAVRELYRDRLAELSLMRGRSQVRMTDLRIAFERHFGRQVLEAIGCGVRTASGEDDWLSRLLRKPRTAQHPLQHLLLMHFLGVEPQEQLARARSMPPRGVAGRAAAAIPTCPNPVCPEAGAAKRSARGQMKSPKRVECSACGMIYQSAPTGGGRVRVWVRGHAWEEKLRALVEDATVSLRETARRLGVTPKAIQGHARRLGVWREAWEASAEPMGGATDQVVLRSRTEAHRAEWLRLQAHHPDEGVKALRVRAPATYAHLYRSDRQWLMEHRPSTRRSPRLPRVDWRDRDRQMLAAARIAVQALRAEPGCPARLTRTAIARRMGHLSLIEQHMDRVPRTRAFLASVVESREAYARRRLRWATEQFRMEGVAPSASQVGRRAGLRPDLATQLAEDVDRAVRSLERTDLRRAS